MPKVFSFETGKKIGNGEIAKIVESKTSVKPITPEEQEEINKKAEEIADMLMKGLKKSEEALKGNSQEKPEK